MKLNPVLSPTRHTVAAATLAALALLAAGTTHSQTVVPTSFDGKLIQQFFSAQSVGGATNGPSFTSVSDADDEEYQVLGGPGPGALGVVPWGQGLGSSNNRLTFDFAGNQLTIKYTVVDAAQPLMTNFSYAFELADSSLSITGISGGPVNFGDAQSAPGITVSPLSPVPVFNAYGGYRFEASNLFTGPGGNLLAGGYTAVYEIGLLQTVAAVPEPATYASMALGLGLVGAVLRRRQAQAKAKTAA
jgi:PEP-CTERM motif